MQSTTVKTYASLQIGRAIAAAIVVAWHLQTIGEGARTLPPQAPWWLSFGYAGVDIFFVFSGFIISLVIARAPRWGDFLISRAKRILPFYWAFTTLALLAKAGKHVAFAPSAILLSYLALPQRDLPALFVGWSLEHEAIFYAIVAVLLMLRRVAILPLILAGLVLIGLVLHVALPVAGRPDPWDLHIASLYQLDFLSGVLIWRNKARLETVNWAAPAIAALALLCIGGEVIARLYGFDHIPTDPTGLPGLIRVLLFGAAGTLLLIALLALEAQRPAFFATRAGQLLHRIGDASYGLYLSHPLIVGAIAAFVARRGFGVAPLLAIKVATFIAAILFALLWYRFAEAPLLARFRSERRPAALKRMDGPD